MENHPVTKADVMSAWRITLLDGPERGRHWTLKNGEMRSLGRSSRCGIQVKEETVSRVCCTLRATQHAVILDDLEPRHCTAVNGEPLAGGQTVSLDDDDQIKVGGAAGWRLQIKAIPVLIDDEQSLELPRIRAVTDQRAGDTETEAMETKMIPLFEQPSEQDSANIESGNRQNEAESEVHEDNAVTAVDESQAAQHPGIASEPKSAAMTALSGIGNQPTSTDSRTISQTELRSDHDPDATRYWPDQPDTEVVELSENTAVYDDQQKNRLRPVLIGTVAAIVIFLILGDRGTKEDKDQEIILGPASALITADFHSEASADGAIGIRPRRGRYPEMLIEVVESTDNRWLSFEKFSEQQQMRISGMAGEAGCLVWMPRMDSAQGNAVMQLFADAEQNVFFCELDGVTPEGISPALTGRARLWLCGDYAVLAVAWHRVGQNSLREINEQLARVFVTPKAEQVFDRRVTANQSRDVESTDIQHLLSEAQRLLKEESIDPANAWRSHQHALVAWRELAGGRWMTNALERDQVWAVVTKSAAAVQASYESLRFEVIRSLQLGQMSHVVAACRQIQERIPNRKDYRWQWAELQQRSAAGDKKGGLF